VLGICATTCATGICATGWAVIAGIIFDASCIGCAGIDFALVGDATIVLAWVGAVGFVFARIEDAGEVLLFDGDCFDFCPGDWRNEFLAGAGVTSDGADAEMIGEYCARV
jgi:hypothetical protein